MPKGSTNQFISELVNQIRILEDGSPVTIAESTRSLRDYAPSADAVADWLWDNYPRAYAACCQYIDTDQDDDITDYLGLDELVKWIEQHDSELYADFITTFGDDWINAATDINDVSSDIDVIYGDAYIAQLIDTVKSTSPYPIESWNISKDGESDDAVCFHLEDAVICVPFRDLTGVLSTDVAKIITVMEE